MKVGGRKRPISTTAVCLFNVSSHCHSCIVKYPFTSRDDWFGNLRETIVLACELFTSSFRLVAQKRRLVKVSSMRVLHSWLWLSSFDFYRR